jgi:hypothetical protein
LIKLVFICGTLEPGKDGVGDYTRRLAGEMIRQGHEASIVAIHDGYTSEIFVGFQHDEETTVPVLRIPSAASKKSLLSYATTFISDANPDWISLQYVPFSFHHKGLHLGLSGILKEIVAGRKWHIMFHEIWVGLERGSKWKFMLLGFFQQLLIKQLLNNLSIKNIHTHSNFYKALLEQKKIKSELLPLFSNLTKSNLHREPRPNPFFLSENELGFVFFGTIHKTTSLLDFLKAIKLFESKTGKRIRLFFIGKNGPLISNWISTCKIEGVKIKVLGEQYSDIVLNLLEHATIGVSTTALAMIEKSGSVAAMLGSGLPVICLSHNWAPRSINFDFIPEGIFKFENDVIERCLKFNKKHLQGSKLPTLTEAFIISLKIQ